MRERKSSTHIDTEIPFKETELYLKQLNMNELNELGRAAMTFAFKGYLDTEKIDKSILERNIAKMRKIFGRNFYVDPSCARRFAGDSSLPRGRYYTIAHGKDGFDDGTLVREMRAYYNPLQSGVLQIFDLTNPRDKRLFGERELPFGAHNFILVFLPQGLKPHPFAKHYTDKPVPFQVVLPLLVHRRRLSKVLDLRIPDVADWFAQMFSRLEWQIGEATFKAFPRKPPLQSFREIIPTILEQALGGGPMGGFCQVVGLWCRKNGVEALIYPSARTDCSVYVKNKKILSYLGWNMVDYCGAMQTHMVSGFDLRDDWPDKVGASPVDDPSSKLGVRGPIWFKDVQIEYTERGPSRGSWHVEGLKKRSESFWRFNMATSLIKERSTVIPQPSIEMVESWLLTMPTAEIMGETSNLIFEAMMGIDQAMKHLSVRASQFELEGNNNMAHCLRDLLGSFELVYPSEAEECDRYIHDGFIRQQQNTKLLPFDELKTRELLGKLAYQMWRPLSQHPVELQRSEIEEILSLSSELDTFLDLTQKMAVLISTSENRFMFKNSSLRDYCAVPEFIKLLDRDYMDRRGIRDRAVTALVQIGPVAVPALLNALYHEQDEVNLGAAVALRKIGSPAIPSLSRALHHEDAKVREWATSALQSYENANAALQGLLSVLHDDEDMVRIGAIIALGESKNPDAIPSLVELLDEEDVSLFAVEALTKIGTPDALNALKKHR